MFDIGWSELMLIGVVALIVIGPKELPSVLRTVGKTVTRLRRMAGEFQGQFQEALREADIADMRKEIKDMTDDASSSMKTLATSDMFDPLRSIRDEIRQTVESAEKTSTPAVRPEEPATASGAGEPLVPLPADEPLPAPVFPEAEPVPAAPTPVVEQAPAAPPASEDVPLDSEVKKSAS